ncbi:MAG: putative sugar nucleotidyl transferase [Armatimonadota bacterium]|nr:putative sugar nucleotidyl transferase [Armatimonadota bacterium]MCX7776768.1 putative sugar nucleotidyl transferase [Armatimonadota bacterium]MDW8024565.1 putative sugar nucleotidyl transferase [Armatimonadota bacterium]
MRTLAIYEDEKAHNFLPMTYIRPVYELRCGALTLRQKAEMRIPHDAEVLFCRGYLCEVMRERYNAIVNDLSQLSGDTVLVNGRAVISADVANKIAELQNGEALVNPDGELVAAIVDATKLGWLCNPQIGSDEWRQMNLREITAEAIVLDYLWRIPVLLEESNVISDDIALLSSQAKMSSPPKGVLTYGDGIFIEEGARIYGGVVISAEDGPVFIASGASITPPTFIQGPSYIGTKTHVDGAKIRPGTVLGPVCRIGGEVEATVIHGYSNKHHDGFIGHSYIGEWVNIGAMTTCSDLKNNYSSVRVWVNGEVIDTGELKIGCFIGDHSKLGIGVMLTTGAVIGIACNIYGAEMTPKFVPSFLWGNSEEGFTVHELDKAIATARKMMSRRKVELTEAEETLLRKVFELTDCERQK